MEVDALVYHYTPIEIVRSASGFRRDLAEGVATGSVAARLEDPAAVGLPRIRNHPLRWRRSRPPRLGSLQAPAAHRSALCRTWDESTDIRRAVAVVKTKGRSIQWINRPLDARSPACGVYGFVRARPMSLRVAAASGSRLLLRRMEQGRAVQPPKKQDFSQVQGRKSSPSFRLCQSPPP